MRRRTGAGLLAAAVLAVVAITGWAVLHGGGPLGPLGPGRECAATVGGRTVELRTEQAENAALIAAVSVRRGMPARAASIALAAAYQESKLYNLETGDRDSLGLFQQRPSQGWGTRAEILDPYHAINAFYDALDRVDGYETMRITVAAQRVQRSGFPEAYAAHAADARVLASALTGNSPGTFSCEVDDDVAPERDRLDRTGLTGRAATVRRDLEAAFGRLPLGGFAPRGVDRGHIEGSAHYEGRAIDVFVRPVGPENRRRGWAIAHYLAAQADRLDIRTLIFDDRVWTAGSRSGKGWRDYDAPRGPGDRAVLEHRDHVHVDVFD